MIRNSFFVSSACFPPASIVPVSNHRDIPSWVRYLLCFFSNLFYRKGSKIFSKCFISIFISSNKSTRVFIARNSYTFTFNFFDLCEKIFSNSVAIFSCILEYIYLLLSYFLIPCTPFKFIYKSIFLLIYQIITQIQKIQYLCFAHPSIQQHCNPVLFIHMISRKKTISLCVLCPKALMPSWKPTVWTSRYRNLLPLLKSSTPISTYSFPSFSKPEK